MLLNLNHTMTTAVDQLVIDSQSRFLEMKSLQPYSTTDEYLYAMKEDLADWLSTMYPEWASITADNFLECLENGVLLCQHANNVNEAARRVLPSSSTLTNCKYRSNARSGTFNARDNVSQFIKWARCIACVREVLMFESDDLILRKNEKNFILCLLEIARFGAKFGVSVPAIIKFEYEIEREIEHDKQKEKLSYTEFECLQTQQHDNENATTNLIDYQSIDINEFNNDNNQTNENSDDIFPSVDANQNYSLEQNLLHLPILSNNNHKRRQNSEESYDSTTSNEITTTIITSNENSQLCRTVDERPKPIVPPASSSHLHKTVVNIVNSCCCSQRFPVIRIGEGKYRIGENGTIIFIRILRNHVMVRVGGGWDTLENYLNKHDPCRRSGHHRDSGHHNHSNIPILALANPHVSPSVQKNTPFGKSITIKTEEFPLPKPTNHDTNLVDAQLVITRGADGRHHIGQITYKAEEDTLNQPSTCPHHQHQHRHSSPLTVKVKSTRTTERSTPPSVFNKQSSPSTDQDYSSLTETTPSKPSSTSSLDFKEDYIEQAIKSLNITSIENQRVRSSSPIEKPIHINTPPPLAIVIQPAKPSNQKSNHIIAKPPSITESIIDTIDGYVPPKSSANSHDFNISDIDDVMGITKKSSPNADTMNMDNDSLENGEGILEEKKSSPAPLSSRSQSAKKSGGNFSTFYLAQKQKFQQEQVSNRQRSASNLNRYATRSNTLPNVVEALKKEEQATKQRRKPLIATTKRAQSSEIIDKMNDISKLDRDSGFDEQDFRRERLHSNGDDNSSMSSLRSPRGSTASSINLDYKENKSYELRMKKLDAKRNSIEKNSPVKTVRNANLSTRRSYDVILPGPPTNKYRKNSQPITTAKK
ncbi:unnamed protein product [Rotaria magnacalcarata]|uniref:GAS2-like protein 1 n=2 Tax=Rotaria magnacalcarata TaxID=392030 RepID=A0A816NC00_9BILA|nr:unnamed protein product [Rotaria magnacalcarata]